MDELLPRSSWGLILAATSLDAHGLKVGHDAAVERLADTVVRAVAVEVNVGFLADRSLLPSWPAISARSCRGRRGRRGEVSERRSPGFSPAARPLLGRVVEQFAHRASVTVSRNAERIGSQWWRRFPFENGRPVTVANSGPSAGRSASADRVDDRE
jgi:hypothetical protein